MSLFFVVDKAAWKNIILLMIVAECVHTTRNHGGCLCLFHSWCGSSGFNKPIPHQYKYDDSIWVESGPRSSSFSFQVLSWLWCTTMNRYWKTIIWLWPSNYCRPRIVIFWSVSIRNSDRLWGKWPSTWFDTFWFFVFKNTLSSLVSFAGFGHRHVKAYESLGWFENHGGN